MALGACTSGPFAVEEDATTTTGRATTVTTASPSTPTSSSTASSRPATGGPGRSLQFENFDSCDTFVAYVREHALDEIGAWGFGGPWFRNGAVEDSASETTTAAAAESDGGAAPLPATGGTSATNTQEEGVDEGDLVETDGRYVYSVVDGQRLDVVDTVDGTKVSSVRLDPDEGAGQMILDGSRLALVVNGWGGGPVPIDDAGRPASDGATAIA